MTKTMFIIAACMAGMAHAAAPKGGRVIIDQTAGSTGTALLSEVAADAFVIAHGAKVTSIVANGQYFNGSGPATSETVTFYRNSKATPGVAIRNCTYTNVPGTDNNGTFTITLPKACTLRRGTYWVSVVANLSLAAGGAWGWLDATETGPYQAEYEDPHGTGSCTTWCKAVGGLNYELIGSGS